MLCMCVCRNGNNDEKQLTKIGITKTLWLYLITVISKVMENLSFCFPIKRQTDKFVLWSTGRPAMTWRCLKTPEESMKHQPVLAFVSIGMNYRAEMVIRLALNWIYRKTEKEFGKRLHQWFEVHKDLHSRKENGVISNVWWRNLWKPVWCFYVVHRKEQVQKFFNHLHMWNF